MNPSRASTVSPDYPLWHERLLERCQQHTIHRDFPTADLAERFSTLDENGRNLPSRELVEFVLLHCTEASPTRSNQKAVAEGALKLIESALIEHGSMLSPVEIAQLKSARGVLHKRLAFGSGGRMDNEQAQAAIGDFRQAADALDPATPQSRLRRHYLWLAVDLLTQVRDASSRHDELANMICDALNGPSRWATDGLYYNCASRLFGRLPSEKIDDVLKQVVEHLLDAWSRVPAAIELPKQQRKEIAVSKGLSSLADFFPADKTTDSAKNPDTTGQPMSGSLAFGENRLEWQPLDRFALCLMLHRCLSNQPLSRIFLAEAIRLRALNRGIIDDEPNSTGLLAYLDARTPPDETGFHEDVDCPSAKAVCELLAAGNLREAIRDGETNLANVESDVQFGRLAVEVARALGDSVSAEAEIVLLDKAIVRLGLIDSQEKALVRGQLHRAKAINRWHTVGGETALEELEQALRWAARAGNVRLATECQKTEYEILRELGRPVSPRRINGFILGAANVWSQFDWMHNLVSEDSTLKFCDSLNTPGTTSLRNLRRDMFEMDWNRVTPETIRNVITALARHETTDEPLVLLEAWEEFFNRVQRVHKSSNKEFGTELSTEVAGNLAQICATRLNGLRSAGARIDVADMLGRWCLSCSHNVSNDVKERIRECLVGAIDLQITELRHTRKRAFLAGGRWKLVKLLSLLVGVSGVSRLSPERCFEWLHFCKAMDADDERPAEEQPSNNKPGPDLVVDAESTSELSSERSALNQAEVRELLTQQHAVLVDYFLGTTDAESFAVVVSGESAVIVPLEINAQKLKEQYLGRVVKAAKETLPPAKRNEWMSLPRALTSLRQGLNQTKDKAALTRAEAAFDELGQTLLPSALVDQIAPYRLIYLVPHSSLFGLPLHLLTTQSGGTLLERCDICFLPKACYLSTPEKVMSNNGGEFVCANVDDENIGDHARKFLTLLEGTDNAWNSTVRPGTMLEQVAASRTAYFFVHGHHAWDAPWLTRLTLPRGIRLTADDIARSPFSFADTEVQLFACHSAHPQLRRAYEMLGLASAFLGKQAASVSASLWPPLASDALEVAAKTIEAKRAGSGRASSFRTALLSLAASHTRFESLLRYGCFVLYGRDAGGDKPKLESSQVHAFA